MEIGDLPGKQFRKMIVKMIQDLRKTVEMEEMFTKDLDELKNILRSFSFSISLSKEYSGLISFRMDWMKLLAVKEFSRAFSNITVQKHQFSSTQLPL